MKDLHIQITPSESRKEIETALAKAGYVKTGSGSGMGKADLWVKREASFRIRLKKLIGDSIWRVCWKTKLSRFRRCRDAGTRAWTWGYREYHQFSV